MITIMIFINCFQNCCLRKHKKCEKLMRSQRCVDYEVQFRFQQQPPVTQTCVKNERKEETRLWLKGIVKRHWRWGRGGEGGLALRIANIFVVLIMNEKRNECSESCRQANFSVVRSNIVLVPVRFFSSQLYQLYFD